MNPKAALTKAALLESLKTSLTDSQRDFAMIDHVILGHGFIVVCGGLALNFTIADRRVTATAGHGKAGRVVRFTREDAEAIAATVTNGRGEKGEAVHVRHAIQKEIAQLQETIAAIEAV